MLDYFRVISILIQFVYINLSLEEFLISLLIAIEDCTFNYQIFCAIFM